MPFDFQGVFRRALPYGAYLERFGTEEHRERWRGVYDAVTLTAEQKGLLASFRRRMQVLCLAGAWCGDCVNACPIFLRFAEAAPEGVIDLRFVNRARDFAAAEGGLAGVKAGTADDPDDIRSTQIGKILVKWGILTPERVNKALLVQEERKAKGLNVKIGDVLADLGEISLEQRDRALAAQSGYGSMDAWDVAVAKELSICGGPRVPVFVILSEDGYECARFGERTLVTYREKAMKKLSSIEGAACPTGLVVPEEQAMAASTSEWLGQVERVQWMLLTSPRLSKLHGEM